MLELPVIDGVPSSQAQHRTAQNCTAVFSEVFSAVYSAVFSAVYSAVCSVHSSAVFPAVP